MGKKPAKDARLIKLRKRNMELEDRNANLALAIRSFRAGQDARVHQIAALGGLAARQRAILRRRNVRLARSRHGRLRHLWIHLRAWQRGFRQRGYRGKRESA